MRSCLGRAVFYQDEKPVRAEQTEDPYRRGMLLIARSITRSELAWLRQTLGDRSAEEA
ncbi:hypothetical protein [Streptomyces massasporeus]|uniref:hypothetical protein n=1 Tax=Streptomyces massasporeus TaxID=67324 RepID=UPI0033D67C2C